MIIIFTFLCVCQALTLVDITDFTNRGPTPEEIRAVGYVAETHHVTTTDGYILEMHRIPFARYQSSASTPRPAVFVMHGLSASSFAFIVLGPETGIVYNLADAGFDVWMGNARGNRYSRYHTTMDPNQGEQRSQFFDFTFDEIAVHDVSIMIDYVLEYTGRDNLHYIGHSQGGTVFLILNSVHPEYNEKFASAHLLAGVGYMEHFPHSQLRAVAQYSDTIYDFAVSLGFVEFVPSPVGNDTAIEIDNNLECIFEDNLIILCNVFQLLSNIAHNIMHSIISEGASVKQFAHYGQNIRDNMFRRYHHGAQTNLQLYGSTEPPIYNISLITVNVTMHYTVSDLLLDERDVLAMVADMPNTVARKVERETFLHEDFVIASDVKELVTEYMIEAMLYIENQGVEDSPEAGSENNSASNITLNNIVKLLIVISSIFVILK